MAFENKSPRPRVYQPFRTYDSETQTAHNVSSYSSRQKRKNARYRIQTLSMGIVPIVAFCLGTWQVQRLRWKVNLIEEYEERLEKPRIALPKKVDLNILDELVYRRFQTTGKFRHDQEILLGPRTRDNMLGYFVITPLERENGTTVLVNRGWISREKANPATRPNSQIEETVVIEGLIKKSEKKNIFTPVNNPEKNEWLWLDLETMAEQTGAQPVIVEQALDVSPYLAKKLIDEGYPVGKIPEVSLRNTHLQYAITWYSISLATSIMLYMLVKKPISGQVNREIMRG